MAKLASSNDSVEFIGDVFTLDGRRIGAGAIGFVSAVWADSRTCLVEIATPDGLRSYAVPRDKLRVTGQPTRASVTPESGKLRVARYGEAGSGRGRW